MPINYLPKTVLEAAIERLNFVFDECDDISVSMSGGKDSTVLFNLALAVARERGRLPLKVMWLDQEAEWQATEDYMRWVMYLPEVRPFWWQIPFRLTNSLSFRDNYLYCWNPADRDKWLREQDAISLKVNPTTFDRFHDLIQWLPSHGDFEGKRHVGVLVGMRVSESPTRRATMTQRSASYKGITWAHKALTANTRVFWPLYDWRDTDIWTAIGRHGWRYNTIYDSFYRYGITGPKMRVSALIHETAWTAIERLQEVEPRIYNRYLARVSGVSCFAHFGSDITPRELPAMFRDWREYRDYLLAHLIDPQHHALFTKRWAGQDGDDWWRTHVGEVLVNDIDGTINSQHRTAKKLIDRSKHGGVYGQRRQERFNRWLAEQR